MYPKYEEDFYGWAMANAQLLKERKVSEIDFDNLIEEIESMGRSNFDQLINRFAVLIAHLLKWQYQPNLKGHSWLYTIREQRSRIKDHLIENPSLKSRIDEAFTKGYRYGVYQAAKETGFDEKDFPSTCPYTFEQCFDEEFYPE